MIIINPGTGLREGRTADNAHKIVDEICQRIGIPRERVGMCMTARGGYWDFPFTNTDGRKQEWSVPGDDPAEFFKSEPWVSARMYVDGNSWLWKYAEGFIADFAACRYNEN